jgi:single-strand DNA-binding protein
MASRSVNKVILLGNLGRDAETKFTPNGTARTTFSIATGRRWKDQQTGEWKEETDWHNVVLWRSENVANFLTKGRQVYIEGRLQSRQYDDKDGNKRYVTEVVADELILVGGRGEGGGPGGGGSAMSEFPDEGYTAPRGGGMQSMPRSAMQQPRGGGGTSRPTGAPPQQQPRDDFGGGGPEAPIGDDDVPF